MSDLVRTTHFALLFAPVRHLVTLRDTHVYSPDAEMSPLLSLPTELMLYIMSFFDVESVLLMRLICTALVPITRSRVLWLTLLHKSRAILPYSSYVRSLVEQNDSTCLDLLPSQASVESAMIYAFRSALTWPRPRMRQPTKLPTPSNNGLSLLFMELFLDRWLLYGYTEGQIYLWDIDPAHSSLDDGGSAPRHCASLDLGSRSWASLAASLDVSHEYIIITLTRASIPSIIQIYRIRIRYNPNAVLDGTTFELLHTLVSRVPQLVRMIEPAMQLMVLSGPSTADIVFAPTGPTASGDVRSEIVQKMCISPVNLEELMNGVVDARIMETYVVVFKARSIEVHPLVSEMNTKVSYRTADYGVRNNFPLASVSFRSVSISDYTVEQGTIFFSFYGYDFLRGLFRFEARIMLDEVSTDQHGPLFELNCVGLYPLSDSIDKDSLSLLSARPDIPSNSHTNDSSSRSDPNSPARVRNDIGHTRMGLGANSLKYLTAMSLGPQGKRAVWVERRRLSTIREVFVWQKRGAEKEVMISREAVYCIESHDPREDLTHCAIGEVSGTIVLGNRAGDVFILGIDL